MSTTKTPRSEGIAPLERAPVPEVQHRRSWLGEFYRSAVGKKYVMAITGIIGLAYLFAHMLGNLKVYLGAEELDAYGEFLRELLVPIFPHHVTLWLMRLVLIAAVVLHVHAGYTLTLLNRRKRPVKYQAPRHYIAADYASRTMAWTGTIVLLFLLYHLADFTWGWVNPGFERGAVYRNFVASLSQVPVALIYIAGNLALGVHLYHGVWSLFQTLGWNNRRFNHWRRYLAIGFVVVVIGGNLTFPLAAMFGIVE